MRPDDRCECGVLLRDHAPLAKPAPLASWQGSRPWRGEPDTHNRGATWQPPADRVNRVQPAERPPGKVPRNPDPERLERMLELRASGLSQLQIARAIGVHQSTVGRYLVAAADPVTGVRLRDRGG